MAVQRRTITIYTYERCDHEWIPRDALNLDDEAPLPTVCPKCKSPYWRRPRQNPKPTAETKRRRKKR